MTNIPDKCSRCGAPIDWEKGASSTKCSYCGKTNYLREFNSSQGKQYSFFYSIKNNWYFTQKYFIKESFQPIKERRKPFNGIHRRWKVQGRLKNNLS